MSSMNVKTNAGSIVLLFRYLQSVAKVENDRVTPHFRMKTLAQKCGLNIRRTEVALGVLIERGFIREVPISKGADKRLHRYQITQW
jgi:hypothetical protein